MLSITETDIRQWADKHQCRSSLPILVRRLIRETTVGIEYFRFPGNEAVDLAGADGEMKTANGSIWVPSGHSFWEMGCNEAPKTKADSDYKDGLTKVDAVARSTATFVFVTPRRWPSKDDWLVNKKSENNWLDVRAFDAVDLETWLEETVATQRWMCELLGKSRSALITPDEWWQRWSNASTPPLSKKLVASRRGDQTSELLKQLRSDTSTISIMGDDHSEAVAFIICAMEEAEATDLLDRTIVVTKGGETLPQNARSRLIAICDLPDGEDIQIPDRQRTTLVRTYPKGRSDVTEALELSHVGSEDFRSELQTMGLTEESARRLALETGHSVTVLRRQLSTDPEINRPIWARDRGEVRQLLPFALVGAWSNSEELSDITALALLGNSSEMKIVEARKRLLELEDAPLFKYRSGNIIVSRIDALFAIGPQLSTTDLDRFFELAPALISERDPALDLPSDQRWMVNVLGKARAYSGGLLSGIGDTLCILAIHGNSICGARLEVDLETRVEHVVRGLLTNVSEDGWLSLRHQLSTLAEASPAAFLDCIEAELRESKPKITAIIGISEDEYNGECLRTDLLWALESLAWHPEYFRRCATILFDLRRFDHLMNDNWSNKPSSSIEDIFRVYPPCSVVDVREKMDILDDLAKTHRAAALDQLLCMLPEHSGGLAMVKSRPRWRDPEADTPVIYNTDAAYAARTASTNIGDLAPFEQGEFEQLLPEIERLYPDDVEKLVVDIERWCSVTGDDEAKAMLSDILRKQSHRRAYLTREKNYEWLEPAFERIETAAEPKLAKNRHRWMFKQDYIEWPQLVGEEEDKNLSWQERDQRVREKRLEALNEIATEDGTDSILPFAISTERADLAADALVRPETSLECDIDWISQALDHDPEKTNNFLMTAFYNKRGDSLTEILSRLAHQHHEPEVLQRIAVCLPAEKSGWLAAASLGRKAEEKFWASANIRIWNDTPEADAEFAAENLLAAGRPRSAFDAFAHSEEKLPNSVWINILSAIAAGEEPHGPFPQNYNLGRIFSRFDVDDKIEKEEILRLELPFVPMMCRDGFKNTERTLEVHRAISRDPALFVQMLSWMYKRKDGAPDPELDEIDPKRAELLQQIAYHTLEGWKIVPGSEDSENFDEAKFTEWSSRALSLAKQASRSGPAYSQLAAIYADFARYRSWDDWLPHPILKLLDSPEHEGLRERFQTAVYNARGVTTRHPHAGGTQERKLADGYRVLAARHTKSFPRMSELLKKIAKSYEWEAKREDEHATVGERWH